MTTDATIKRLERRLTRNAKGKRFMIWRDIIQDGRLLSASGFVVTERERELIQKEDVEIRKRGGIVCYKVSYAIPKLKPESATAQYYVRKPIS